MATVAEARKRYRVVGKSFERVDGTEKVTGEASFAVDMTLPRMLHGKIVRNQVAPHALIKNIDTSSAEKLPGVKGVVTPANTKTGRWGAWQNDYPVFPIDGRVRFLGEPIAAVAATDPDIAEEAASLVRIEFEEQPAVFDPFEALKDGAPILHPELENYSAVPSFPVIRYGNVATEVRMSIGDVNKGFLESDRIFEHSFKTSSHHQCYMEPHAAIAQADRSRNVTVWTSTQTVFDARRELADALQLHAGKIRVIAPYVGGGFGGKLDIRVEPYCILLAQKTHRPVKIVLSREEELSTGHPRHPFHVNIKMGAKTDGTFLTREVNAVMDSGAYAHQGSGVCSFSCLYGGRGPYNIPNVKIRNRLVYTNKLPCGGFRGFGNPQMHFAGEQLVDIIAHDLGIDPADLRRKNALKEGDRMATGQVAHNVGIRETIDECVKRSGWENPKTTAKDKKFGRGIASMVHCAGIFTSGAIVQVTEHGSLVLMAGCSEIGAGQKTVLSQIAAEEFGVDLKDVSIVVSDTGVTPYDWATDASRVTYNVGNAIRIAAADAREDFKKIAADMFECPVEDLVFENKTMYPIGSPDQAKSLEEIALYGLYVKGGTVIGKGSFFRTPPFSPEAVVEGTSFAPFPTNIFATQIAEVEVDEETGRVKLLRFTSAHDVGYAINPVMVEGQIEGASATGIGYATMEEVMVDEAGAVVNPTMLDYKMPTTVDMPEVVPIYVENHDPTGPFGAKGVGEPGLVPTAAAIANAVYDAVGVRITELPITPEKVLSALKQKKQKG
ncbi:MAG: xanthine dehydrogenase family protein molybdopterin-binding subunit [Nitrospinota bacterium]